MTQSTDYPVAAPSGIDPIIFRSEIISAMAHEYFTYMQGSEEEFSRANAVEAAIATWDTDWETDPAPRTIEQGILEAGYDLQYWNED